MENLPRFLPKALIKCILLRWYTKLCIFEETLSISWKWTIGVWPNGLFFFANKAGQLRRTYLFHSLYLYIFQLFHSWIFEWFLCPLEIFLSFSSLLSTRCSVLISSTIWKEFKIDDCLERILGNFWVSISVTRLDNLLHFGQLFKACGKNYFAQIAHISGNFSKGVKKFLWNNFWATFIDIWRLFTGHTRLAIYKTKSSEWIQRNIL